MNTRGKIILGVLGALLVLVLAVAGLYFSSLTPPPPPSLTDSGHDTPATVPAQAAEAVQPPEQAVVAEEKSNPLPIEIVHATWGVPGVQLDVTDLLNDFVHRGEMNLHLIARNLGDPAPQEIKQLVVTYRVNNQSFTKTFREDFTMDFAELAVDPAMAQLVPQPPKKWTTVQFTSQNPREAQNGSPVGSLLIRELQRQAALIAARDELGVATVDMSLGEPLQEEDPLRGTLLTSTQLWMHNGLSNALAIPGGDGATDWKKYADIDVNTYVDRSKDKLLIRNGIALSKEPFLDYAVVLTETERESRTTDMQALKMAGISAAADFKKNWIADARPSPVTARLLQQMNIVSQFAAIRALHAQIHAGGESPQLLEALVHGYGNLGYLTFPLYRGIGKAYSARGLLYAQRLVIHQKSDAQSLYVRAYAEGMAGLLKLAMDDLAAARQKPAAAEATGYAAVIDALYHNNLHNMAEAESNDEYKNLAQMLAVSIACDAYPEGTIAQAAQTALHDEPQNLCVMQMVYRSGQQRESLARKMLGGIAAMIRDQTAALGLPGELEQIRLKIAGATDDPARAQLVSDYCDALDQCARNGQAAGEPSVAALAALLREESFLASYLMTKEARDAAGTRAALALSNQIAPAWKNHGLAGLVRMMGLDPDGQHTEFRAALDSLNLTDAVGWWYYDEIYNWLKYRGSGISGQDSNSKWEAWMLTAAHGDLVTMDHSKTSLDSVRLERDDFIAALRDMAPYSTLPLYAWIANTSRDFRLKDQKRADEAVTLATDRFGNQVDLSTLAAALALDVHDPASAINILKGLHERSPSLRVDMLLVKAYELTGQLDDAARLVDADVKLPDMNSALTEEMAYAYMAKHKGTEAQKYANLTMQLNSYDGWRVVSNIEDALGHFDKAAAALAVGAHNNPDVGLKRQWSWSSRLDRPEAAEAKAKFEAQMDAEQDNDPSSRAWVPIIDGRTDAAFQMLKAHSEYLFSIDRMLTYVVLAAECGDTQVVQSTLKTMAGYSGNYENRPAVDTIVALHNGVNPKMAVLKFELGIGPYLNTDSNLLVAWVGEFLAATGNQTEARRLLTRALVAPWGPNESYIRAWAVLKKMGDDPAKIVAAARAKTVDLTALAGTWAAVDSNTTEDWTFSRQGAVISSTGLRGWWWEDSDRILINWTPAKWAVIPLPLDGKVLHGDTASGEGKLTLTRK